MSNTSKTVFVLVLMIIAVVALFVNKTLRSQQISKEGLRQLGAIVFEKSRTVPQFHFTDQNNNAFTNSNLTGGWTFLFPGFSFCPDICPQTLLTLNNFYEKLSQEQRNKVQIILLSVDPDRDTTDRLKSYINYFNENFIAISSSSVKDIINFGIAINVVFSVLRPEEKQGNYNIDHSANITIFDDKGNYAGFIKPPLTEQNLYTILSYLQQLDTALQK